MIKKVKQWQKGFVNYLYTTHIGRESLQKWLTVDMELTDNV